ncbi:MAG: hypothetical protein AAF657_24505 [Acidobacteriota bacterium]
MLVADLADVPFRHPFYELAYGTSTAAEIRGYALADPWSFEDPGNRGEHAWSDVQSGEITVLSPLGLVLVMPPPYLDRRQYFDEFERVNPQATPFLGVPETPSFVIVQNGAGVEGLGTQILLTETGEVTVWHGWMDWDALVHRLEVTRETSLPQAEAQAILQKATKALPPEEARVFWNCNLSDGAAVSLITSIEGRLSRGHWINLRTPSQQALEVIESLYGYVEHSRRDPPYGELEDDQ